MNEIETALKSAKVIIQSGLDKDDFINNKLTVRVSLSILSSWFEISLFKVNRTLWESSDIYRRRIEKLVLRNVIKNMHNKTLYPKGKMPDKVSWNGSIKCKECAFCLALALVVLFIFALSIALGN
jgi:hypothetical protein